MNSLSDLRSTLDEHAERVADAEAIARTAAVHHRVSAVRRRRRAVSAGVLSLALLAGGAAALGNRDHGDALPAAPTILGVKAPVTMTSLGYTYRTDGSSHTVEGERSIPMEASALPRLVSWTTDRPTTVHLQLPGNDLWTSTVSGFHDSVVIPPGMEGKLSVSVDAGRVGLATYDLTDAQPDGVTRDDITFRRTVAQAPLLAAAIGTTGQTQVRTSFVGVKGQVSISVLCSGVPSDSSVHVVMGHGAESSGGCGNTSFDPGSYVIGMSPLGHAGRRIPVRVWVSGPGTDTPLPAGSTDGARIGVGLYAPVATERVAGSPMNRTIEYGGHTWHLAEVERSIGGPIRLSPRSEPTVAMVGMAITSGKPTFVHFRAIEAPDQLTGYAGAGSGSAGPFWVPAGARARASRSTPGALGVAVYERSD